MTVVLSLAIIIGLIHAYQSIYNVRHGLSDGVKPSNSLVEFTFLNK